MSAFVGQFLVNGGEGLSRKPMAKSGHSPETSIKKELPFLVSWWFGSVQEPEATSGTLLEVSMLRHQDMALLEPCSIRPTRVIPGDTQGP